MRHAIKLTLFCLILSSSLFAADFRFVRIDFPGATARGDYTDKQGNVHDFKAVPKD